MTITAKDQFDIWLQIANRLNEVKNIVLEKHDQIPSFNQVQAKQYEEYTNEMRHALPMAGMEAMPDIKQYTLTQEQYIKSIKEFFPYYDELESFIHSKEFQDIFTEIKQINLTLKDQLPDLFLEYQLNNHLNDKPLDMKDVEELLRRNIADIIKGEHPSEQKATQIMQVIVNTYYYIQKTSGGGSLGFLGWRRDSKLGLALGEFINTHGLLGENKKVPRNVKPDDKPPSIK